MLRTKFTHTYTHYKFIQGHYTTNTQSQSSQHRFNFINSKYISPYFLNFTDCIKNTSLHGILRNYDPIRQMYTFCPLTRSFDVDDSSPLINPHEYIQPVEILILENIHNVNYHHKLYNLIQNKPHEFSLNNKELNTIRALEFLWLLLQIKKIIRMLAKFHTSSDTIRTNFSNRLVDEDNPL